MTRLMTASRLLSVAAMSGVLSLSLVALAVAD